MLARLKASCAAAALCALLPAAAHAQDDDAPLYVDADNVSQNRETGVVTAMGGVRLQSGTRIVLADEVEYDTDTGRVVARGGVEIYDGDAPVQTADEIELTDELGEGVALGFASLLENNGRTGAAFALRRPSGRIELSDAFYTACDLCEDGSQEPTWRLRADEVIRDEDSEMIYYRDVRLEVLGRPVAYSPAFAHADPAAERKSGFLIPGADLSNRTGFNFVQPYYWAISPYQDLTVAPRLTTEVNPLLELQYRKRFYSGFVRAEGSVTNERDFDQDGKFGDQEWRGHLFAEGEFRLADNWSWGFGVERITDTLYLRKYGYPDRPETETGLYGANRELISQIFARGRSDWYYVDVAAMDFQSARPQIQDSTLPQVAPIVRVSALAPVPAWMGQVRANVSAVSVTREQGDDYHRASADLDWSRPFTVPGGLRATPYAFGRVDAYDIELAGAGGAPLEQIQTTRSVGSAGLDIAYPFVRPGDFGDVYIEPRVRTAASTGLNEDQIVPNQDSVGFELSRSNLFARNRAGGFDLWEEGVRVDAGATVALASKTAWLPDLELFNGLSYRLDGDPAFEEGSGVETRTSDLVSELEVDFGFLNAAAATRYDTENNALQRVDLLAGFNLWRISGAADYSRVEGGARQREEVDFSAEFDITANWSAAYRVRHDIRNDVTRSYSAGLIYRDECTDFRILYERDNLQLGNLGPTESVKVQFVLFTLGGVEG